MLAEGRGRWVVSQKPKLIKICYGHVQRTTPIFRIQPFIIQHQEISATYDEMSANLE